MSEEQTEVIPLSLPMETWGVLALEAHRLEMTLNDYILMIVMREVVETPGMTMCSADWLKYDPNYEGYAIVDPDGWDRANFDQSWAELITREEFTRRVMLSSTIIKR